VLDEHDRVLYTELVPEIANEPTMLRPWQRSGPSRNRWTSRRERGIWTHASSSFCLMGRKSGSFVEEFTLLLAGTVRLGRDQVSCTAVSDGSGEPPRARMRIACLSPSSQQP